MLLGGGGSASPRSWLPLTSAEEIPLNCRHEWLQPARDAVPVSMELLFRALKLFRAHADENGEVGIAQLAAIRQSQGYAEFGYFCSELRTVQLAPLDDEERVALWINLYNLLCMHGCVEHHARLRAGMDILSTLRLHRRFRYEVGGLRYSAIQLEHAMLRATRPRPAFVGTRLVIPKFRADDPRLRGAPKLSSALLAFGLHPGTAFSPPLRVFNSRGVLAELAENARCFLAPRVSCDEQAAAVVLPIQLLWHHLDFGATPPEMLHALLPLLPRHVASALDTLLQQRPRAIQVSYTAYSWDVQFKVGSGSRVSGSGTSLAVGASEG